MADEREKLSDDALDRLLTRARWPEPSPQAIDRLSAAWQAARAARSTRPSRRWSIVGWSMGAAVAASVGILVWMQTNHLPKTKEVVVAATPKPMPALVREPTALERLVAVSSERRLAGRFVAAATSPAPPDMATELEPLFVQLTAPRVDDRLEAARALAARNDPAVTDRLIAMLPDPGIRREVLTALVQSDEPRARAFVQAAAASDRSIASLIRTLEPGT